MIRSFTKKFNPTSLTRTFTQRRQYTRAELQANNWVIPDDAHFTAGVKSHKSTGIVNIKKLPVIEVDSDTVRVVGGNMNMGHPQVYYALDVKNPEEPVTCKWSGLRFKMKQHH